MRRSLPATSSAPRTKRHAIDLRCASGVDHAPADDVAPRASRAGAPGRARATRAARCSLRRARRARLFEHGAALFVEPGVRLVEQTAARGLRASASASDSRRRWPCDRRPCATLADRGQADPLDRGVGVGGRTTGGARREPRILGDREVVVAERLVADERDRCAAPICGRARDRHRAPRPRRRAAAPDPRRGAAASSCPRRWGRSAARSRRSRPRDRRRRARETGRACRRPSEGERSASRLPGDGRSLRTPPRAANRPGHSRYPDVRATDDRRHRAHAGDAGAPDPAVRRLPALGHRHLHRARPDQAEERLRQKQLQQYDEQDTVGPHAPSRPTKKVVRGLPQPAPPIPKEGDVGGIITIPAIDIRFAFVEGTSRDDLKKGPGHYPDTPFPGTIGNAAIAGHRTTYLHPFYDIDKLKPGDDILIETFAGKFTYKMYQTADRRADRRVGRRQHTRRRAHAHELQPEVLGLAAHRDQGEARAADQRRCRRSRARSCSAAGAGKARPPPAALEEGLVGAGAQQGPDDLVGRLRGADRASRGGGRSGGGGTRRRGRSA